ncbi:hypothetical protein CVT25_009826 [Psilocybe cyanescens]|uniref:F-box domain-containing protein n=1 Tax=Psilocybe cyanescens TaxID=93625 RepID=A0A409X878_PSICY|nr:hypothetical protein CVT25_009826 [Psilocybe cyanescens]
MLTGNPQSALERVATETWFECLRHVGMEEYRSMLQTCQYFRQMCLPLVFKEATCSLSFDRYHVDPEVQYALLDNFIALAKSDVHAPLVRKLTVYYEHRFPGSHSRKSVVTQIKLLYYPRFVNLFVELLPHFSNLRVVDITYSMNMDKMILAALAAVPNLDELGMRLVRFSAHRIKKRVRVQIRKLGIFNDGSDCNPNRAAKMLDVFSGERLEDLTVLSRAYSPKIMRALTAQNNCTILKSISILLHQEDNSALIPFLVSCPNLESIDLSLGDSPGSAALLSTALVSRLPISALKNLHSFSGPDEVAMVLVPKRPVKKVTTVHGSTFYYIGVTPREYHAYKTMLARLSESTGPVTDLVIQTGPLETGLLDLIVRYIPYLSSLRLDVGRKQVLDDDPFNYSLDIMLTDQDECGGTSTETGSDIFSDHSSRYLLPLVRHNKYMRIMHWIALHKIVLPRNLAVLNLYDDHFSWPWENFNMTCFYDGIVVEPSEKEAFLNNEEKHGRAHTFLMARSIFATISQSYPSLREVNLLGNLYRTEFFWYKNPAGTWDLCDFKPQSP